MKYYIYQLKDENIPKYGFMSWEYACKHNFSFDDYEKCYEGNIDKFVSPNASLEKLYTQFNIGANRPEDFKGHSLSMSDIVVFDEPDGTEYYYCDTVGWEQITRHI